MKELFKNVVDLKTSHEMFKNPAYSYSVSGRWITPKSDIVKYLQFFFIYIDFARISSVFGSTAEPSAFYGGRVYDAKKSLTQNQIDILYRKKINLALTLTNHFYSAELYGQNQSFLDKYHRKGNVIICTSDELARMIRKDFPLYHIRASIIKNLNSVAKVRKAFELYDDVVIPMDMNDDDEFLESVPEKDRIMLFANAACAYNCPSRVCYPEISKFNQAKTDKVRCKKQELGLLEYAFYFFNVEKFHDMGFSNFKLIPTKLFGSYLKSSAQ
ncbi:MAG: hypothetical protein NT040_19585 [Bacteroidetes bacterium]|nr:hypothetical protein [Bacteroidota bacterium]